MNETGAVKFKCEQVAKGLSRFAELDELNLVRRKLVNLGMVGVDADGISFGNLSVRDGATSQFYITASGTGSLTELTLTDFSRVVAYDFVENWLRCEGPRIASSESLTHAAVYESDPTARAVIHCHDVKLWSALLENAPATAKAVEYGTPEMAYAVQRLFETTDVKEKQIFVMTVHHGGLVTFGKNVANAFGLILRELNRIDNARRGRRRM